MLQTSSLRAFFAPLFWGALAGSGGVEETEALNGGFKGVAIDGTIAHGGTIVVNRLGGIEE
jgi:hypothetical protein